MSACMMTALNLKQPEYLVGIPEFTPFVWPDEEEDKYLAQNEHFAAGDSHAYNRPKALLFAGFLLACVEGSYVAGVGGSPIKGVFPGYGLPASARFARCVHHFLDESGTPLIYDKDDSFSLDVGKDSGFLEFISGNRWITCVRRSLKQYLQARPPAGWDRAYHIPDLKVQCSFEMLKGVASAKTRRYRHGGGIGLVWSPAFFDGNFCIGKVDRLQATLDIYVMRGRPVSNEDMGLRKGPIGPMRSTLGVPPPAPPAPIDRAPTPFFDKLKGPHQPPAVPALNPDELAAVQAYAAKNLTQPSAAAPAAPHVSFDVPYFFRGSAHYIMTDAYQWGWASYEDWDFDQNYMAAYLQRYGHARGFVQTWDLANAYSYVEGELAPGFHPPAEL